MSPYRNYDVAPKVQFVTSTEMPHLIFRACLATGTVSNTAYIQRAVAEALARDLGLDLDQILANLPPNRGPAAHLYDPAEATMVRGKNNTARFRPVRIGPVNGNETTY